MADLAQVTEKIRAAVGDNSGLGKTVKLDLDGQDKIFIDGASVPNTVTNEDKPADATVSMKWDDFMNETARASSGRAIRRRPASVEMLNSDTSGKVNRERKRMGLATEMATFSGLFIARRLGINSPITSVK